MPESRRIYFIGVCGTAMATLAALLQRSGHRVQGSDENVYPPMSDFLVAEGIQTFTGYAADHITSDVDLVIVGNATGASATAPCPKPFATSSCGVRAPSSWRARMARPPRRH